MTYLKIRIEYIGVELTLNKGIFKATFYTMVEGQEYPIVVLKNFKDSDIASNIKNIHFCFDQKEFIIVEELFSMIDQFITYYESIKERINGI